MLIQANNLTVCLIQIEENGFATTEPTEPAQLCCFYLAVLGCPDVSFMAGFLFLKMQMQGKKRSKIGHLARIFNAAAAFSGAKYTLKSNG
ncbi:hypothetical protein LVJ83_09550 [Uruburuella testudinis]|uniref:Uncharacterized protein n=1 Tax=Uruburuella testudinis TaxID=1282863 RepID=A0ABY4DQ97_9NEIS|nr:hypothetical protein [Uruburuella testudinis]UOO81211.1 hypothetical protein LVJ83_09550 [Uruburuella testudinis]